MAFGGSPSRPGAAPLAEINMVPLIDVMLVLLVIFMVTAPMMTQSVPVNLPKATGQPAQNVPDRVTLSIDATGQRYWNTQPVSREDAATRFREAAGRTPQPLVELRGDGEAAYRWFAETMADATQAGLTRLSIITSPDSAAGGAPAPAR